MAQKYAGLVPQKYELIPEWENYQVHLPATANLPFYIDEVILTEEKLGLWEGVDKREWFMGRGIPPGIYTRLSETVTDEETGKPKRLVWMSDTPAEIIDHWEAIEFLRDNPPMQGDSILITGLGIGMVLNAALLHGWDATVIDLNPKVIELVGEHYHKMAGELGQELRIIEADAKTWKPDRKFAYGWHDIWPKISDENIPEMMEMFKHYANAVKGPQNAWAIRECLAMDLAIRLDRSDDEAEELVELFQQVIDGNWLLIGDFMDAFTEGRIW